MRQLRLIISGFVGVVIASGCQCGDSLSQLPAPAARLVHGSDETPPLDHLAVDIGSVEIDARVEITFTLRNDGNRNLVVNGMQLTTDSELCPVNEGAFQLEPLDDIVPPGEGRDFRVAYIPSFGGAACTVVEVATNDQNHPLLRAVLSGRGDSAALCAQTELVNFGDVAIGDSRETTVVLRACGTKPITLDGLIQTGPFPPFEASILGGLPLTLDVDEIVILQVGFAPTELRDYSVAAGNAGVIDIETTPVTTTQVTLIGRGTACDLVATPAALNFGSLEEGQSATQMVTLRASGGIGCNVNDLYVDPGSSPFSIPSTGLALPGLIDGTQEVAVPVTFTAAQPLGAANAVLKVASDDPQEPLIEIPLQAESLQQQPCSLAATPNPIDFGGVTLGRTQTLTVTLSSVGSQSCTVSMAQLSAGSDWVFSLDPATAPQPPFNMWIMPPGSDRTLDISFNAFAPQAYTGELEFFIIANLFAPKLVIPVIASGSGPALCVEPNPVTFPTQPLNTPVTRDVTLTACGDATVTVEPVTSFLAPTSSEFFLDTPIATAIDLAPGQRTILAITYTAIDDGTDNGTLRLRSNDLIYPTLDLPLVAGGSADPCGDLSGSICGLDGEPLSDARVWVDTGSGLVETTTDNFGQYHLRCLPEGTYTVNVESGSWGTTIPAQNVTPYQEINRTIPDCLDPTSANVAVVYGEWDRIEGMLDNLNIPYTSYGDYNATSDLVDDASVLNSYDIVFFNCGFGSESDVYYDPGRTNVIDFVANGGSIYATDYAYDIVEQLWPSYIDFWGNDTQTDAAQSAGSHNGPADVVDPSLQAGLNGRPTINISSCCTAIDTVDSPTTVYLESDRLGDGVTRPLMVGFQPGAGNVFYTDFHNDEQQDANDIIIWVIHQL